MKRSERTIEQATTAVINELRATQSLARIKFPDGGETHDAIITRDYRLRGMRYALNPQLGVSDLPVELGENAINVLQGIKDVKDWERGRKDTEVAGYVRNLRGR